MISSGEMVQRLEREKMNADIAQAAASGKFTFGVASTATQPKARPITFFVLRNVLVRMIQRSGSKSSEVMTCPQIYCAVSLILTIKY